MPDKEKTKLVATSTEKRKADDIEIKDLKKVNESKIDKPHSQTHIHRTNLSHFTYRSDFSAFFYLSLNATFTRPILRQNERNTHTPTHKNFQGNDIRRRYKLCYCVSSAV